MTSTVDNLTSKDVKELLCEKYILVLGDSVVRGLYKDLIKFYNSDDLISEDELRLKGENRFSGDRLINGGIQKGLTNGIDYEEVREYTSGGRLRIRFYFLTRCYSTYIKDVIFKDIKNQAIKPDIIIMNSCVWDISRYGIYAMRSYQRNLDSIMGSFRQMLPNTFFLWLSALPVSNSSKGGVIVSSAEYIRPILPGLIRDGNYYCSQMCHIHDVLYIDLHSIFSTMLHLRRPDGIHWCAIGTRLMNEILLNHIKAYYHGEQLFKCPLLRAELGSKINTFKQRMKNHNHYSKTNYLDQEIPNVDDETSDTNSLLKCKRKRNRDDDEKENVFNDRKVIIKTSINETQQRTVILKESTKKSEVKQERIPINQMDKFDHNYCDIMYDNEFEGLNLLHYSSYDIEESEQIGDLFFNNSIQQISNEQIIDIKSNIKIISTKSLSIVNEEKDKYNEPDYIILSSDDEDEDQSETDINSNSSFMPVLPIYLLNHLN